MQIFAPGTLEMMVGLHRKRQRAPGNRKGVRGVYPRTYGVHGTMLPYGASMMRVIPIESAIAGDSQAIPYEKISYYLDKYDTFSVSPCSCRRSRRLLDEGCGHLEDDMCVQMGSGAEYFIKTGKARQITREEAEADFQKSRRKRTYAPDAQPRRTGRIGGNLQLLRVLVLCNPYFHDVQLSRRGTQQLPCRNRSGKLRRVRCSALKTAPRTR